jgi:hypothetical protein
MRIKSILLVLSMWLFGCEISYYPDDGDTTDPDGFAEPEVEEAEWDRKVPRGVSGGTKDRPDTDDLSFVSNYNHVSNPAPFIVGGPVVKKQ